MRWTASTRTTISAALSVSLLLVAALAQSDGVDQPTINIRFELPRPSIGTGVIAPKDSRKAVEFVVYRENGLCKISNFEVRGGCHRTDKDPLGIYFPQFSATCERQDGAKLSLSEFMSGAPESDRQRVLLEQHRNDGPFPGCLKPESWKQISSEICRLSCREQYASFRTNGKEIVLQLPAGSYFLEVPKQSFSLGDWDGVKLPITPLEVKDGHQSFTFALEPYRIDVCY